MREIRALTVMTWKVRAPTPKALAVSVGNPAVKMRKQAVAVAVAEAPQNLRKKFQRPSQTNHHPRLPQRLTPMPHGLHYSPSTMIRIWKMSRKVIAMTLPAQDIDFGEWRDYMIREGYKEWAKWDKMICNHADPHKRAKHPDPLGAPIAYMESKDAFKPIKTSEYGLCHFYQVGTMGEFSPFPKPRQPMTSNDVHHLLKKACSRCGQI